MDVGSCGIEVQRLGWEYKLQKEFQALNPEP